MGFPGSLDNQAPLEVTEELRMECGHMGWIWPWARVGGLRQGSSGWSGT